LGFLRAFFFAPSSHIHDQDVEAIHAVLTQLPASEIIEGAYRRSGGRQASFYFAQGIVVGALGNLFASFVGHFIDRVGRWTLGDTLWCAVGGLSVLVMTTMTWGAVRRYRQNAQVEALFLNELKRRGGTASNDSDNPDDLFLAVPGDRPRRKGD